MEVVIIGNGLNGYFSAYYLIKQGFTVSILGQEGSVKSASFGNAGMICPSHFIPLASPGIIWQGIKWMFDRESPLLFHPSFNLDFIAWCWKFYKSSSKSNVSNNQGLMNGLLQWSKDLYLELELNQVISSLKKKGIIMYCKTDHALKEEIEVSHTANKMGIATQIVTNTDIQNYNPGIDCTGKGGVHYTGDMHIDPEQLMQNLESTLLHLGVKFIKEDAIEFVQDQNRITHVKTTNQMISTDVAVLCTGMHTPILAKKLNYHLLLQGGKGYNITLDHAIPNLTTPFILVEGRVALTPMGKKLRIGGTMELGHAHTTIEQSRVNGILKNTESYLPNYKSAELKHIEPWYGYRPLSVDGMPIIKKIPHMQNAFINTGHGMLGLSLAPASAKLITQMISNSL